MQTELDLFNPAFLADPYPALARLRRAAPVHPVGDSGFYLVSSWELVQEAVARTEDFSSHLTAALTRTPTGVVATDLGGFEQVLATADDPAHKLHRSVVLGTIGKRIRSLQDAIEVHVARLWRAHFQGERADWVGDMADRLPLLLVAELVGLPPADVPQLLRWAYDGTEMLGGLVDEERLGEVIAASAELWAYLARRFQEALSDPRDDLLGELVRACRAGEIEEQTAVLILLQLVEAGGESTAALIGTAALKMASDPALQDQVRRQPALLDPLLDECLRLESPFRGHTRHVVADTSLGGVDLPAGSTLMLLWGAANRDEARFAQPDVLDLGRPALRQHLAFGRGTHFCVGSPLARMEATAALRALLAGTRGFTLDGADAQAWVPSLFVRRHARLRLRLEPVSAPDDTVPDVIRR